MEYQSSYRQLNAVQSSQNIVKTGGNRNLFERKDAEKKKTINS